MAVKTKASIKKERVRNGCCASCGNARTAYDLGIGARINPSETQCGACRYAGMKKK